MKKIKIITYNLHKGFQQFGIKFVLNEIKIALHNSDADIVFLQEAVGRNHLKQNKIKYWPKSSQYEYLADQMWPHNAYGKNAINDHSDHGNAILSKFSFQSSKNINISTNKLEKRGLLHGIIEVENTKIHVLNTHLNLLETSRLVQAQKIIQYIDKNIHPNEKIILAGDFNDWTQSARKFFQHYKFEEAFFKKQKKCPNTYPAIYPVLSLDRVFVRNLKITSAIILKNKPWNKLSDHIPLQVEIGLK